MSYILQVDFPYTGPWNEEFSNLLKDLAESISLEKGLIWKIWTENEDTLEAGGIYLFDTAKNAQAYLKMHSERVKKMGVPHVNAKIFRINEPLSILNHAPL